MKISDRLMETFDSIRKSGITVLTNETNYDGIVSDIFSSDEPRAIIYAGNGKDANAWLLSKIANESTHRKHDTVLETMQDRFGDAETMMMFVRHGYSFDEYLAKKDDGAFRFNMFCERNDDEDADEWWLTMAGISDKERNINGIDRYVCSVIGDIEGHETVNFTHVLINDLNGVCDAKDSMNRYERFENVCSELKVMAEMRNFVIVATVDVDELDMTDEKRYDSLTLTCLNEGVKVVRRETGGNPVFSEISTMKDCVRDGSRNGEVFVFQDEPKKGKTWEMTGIAVDSIRHGNDTIFINFENAEYALTRRMMAHYCGMTMEQYRSQCKDIADLYVDFFKNKEGMEEATLAVESYKIGDKDVADIEKCIRSYGEENVWKIRNVIIDDIYCLKMNGGCIHESMKESISQISTMAKRNGWNVFCSMNLNRSEWK